MFPVQFTTDAVDGNARAGTAVTHRGSYTTPCFMPVGTRGAIKYLSAADYEDLGAQIVLGNTYHLMLRPGAETVSAMGGLGAFAGWKGLTLTDSGGFQVFSLNPDVDDDGVTFKSTYDGSRHRYTPESAVHTQQLLGADIQMVLDVCPPLPSPAHVVRPLSNARHRGRSAPFQPTRALINRCLGLCRAALMSTCVQRAQHALQNSTLTDTASEDCRLASRARRCCQH